MSYPTNSLLKKEDWTLNKNVLILQSKTLVPTKIEVQEHTHI